jgi:hypothetical protein
MDESSFAWIDENTRGLLEVALHLDEPSVIEVWGRIGKAAPTKAMAMAPAIK